MNMWDDLPNARHIDWVLQSQQEHPDHWGIAYTLTWLAASLPRPADELAKFQAARSSLKIRSACDTALRIVNSDMTRYSAWLAARASGPESIGDSLLALIAYDDCAHLLDLSREQLLAWSILTEHPASTLLRAAVIARELIASGNTA
jgi:hypothetical protein